MNTSSQMDPTDVLRVNLAVLQREHGDLNDAIDAMQQSHHVDALQLQRLKRQKLALKDRIARLEDQLTPDIIA